MKHDARLDVSVKEFSIRVVDETGAVQARRSVACDPAAVARFSTEKRIVPVLTVHESSQLSVSLQRSLSDPGLAVTCVDARVAHKVLSSRLNKSDAAGDHRLVSRMCWKMPIGPARRPAAPRAASARSRRSAARSGAGCGGGTLRSGALSRWSSPQVSILRRIEPGDAGEPVARPFQAAGRRPALEAPFARGNILRLSSPRRRCRHGSGRGNPRPARRAGAWGPAPGGSGFDRSFGPVAFPVSL